MAFLSPACMAQGGCSGVPDSQSTEQLYVHAKTVHYLRAHLTSRWSCAYTLQAVVKAWDDGIGRLVGAGVTGTILLGNMGSVKGLQVSTMLAH